MPHQLTWTDAPAGSAAHVDGVLVCKVRKLGVGGWSAWWNNGMKWDERDQLTQVNEQASRYFERRDIAKLAVEGALTGYWREPLQLPQNGETLEWIKPGVTGLQTWIGLLRGKPVARISRQPGFGSSCSAAIDGWMWTEQMPGSLGARLGIKESPTRGFKSVPEAKRAIKAAFAAAANT